MELQFSKQALRHKLKKIRSTLPESRRKSSRNALLNHMLPALSGYDFILSFASFRHEIDTTFLNLFLASNKRLLLPTVEKNKLRIFQISDPKTQMIPTSYGLYQPNPDCAFEVDPQIIQTVIVPAIGFDQNKNRLGYGKGIYDRFLKTIPEVLTIGIGYKEQLVKLLPIEETDVPLRQIALF